MVEVEGTTTGTTSSPSSPLFFCALAAAASAAALSFPSLPPGNSSLTRAALRLGRWRPLRSRKPKQQAASRLLISFLRWVVATKSFDLEKNDIHSSKSIDKKTHLAPVPSSDADLRPKRQHCLRQVHGRRPAGRRGRPRHRLRRHRQRGRRESEKKGISQSIFSSSVFFFSTS